MYSGSQQLSNVIEADLLPPEILLTGCYRLNVGSAVCKAYVLSVSDVPLHQHFLNKVRY